MSRDVSPVQAQTDYLKYRDISKSDEYMELAGRVAMVVALVLVLSATIVGIRHLQNSFEVRVTPSGLVRYISHAPLAIFPGLFGTAAMVALILGLYFFNMEKIRNGEKQKSLKTEGARAERLFQLRASSLETVYQHYYKRNGGLGPLVRNQVLTIKEAEALKQILTDYAPLNEVISDWTSPRERTAEFINLVKNNPEDYLSYNSAQRSVTELEASWEELKKTLGKQPPKGDESPLVVQ